MVRGLPLCCPRGGSHACQWLAQYQKLSAPSVNQFFSVAWSRHGQLALPSYQLGLRGDSVSKAQVALAPYMHLTDRRGFIRALEIFPGLASWTFLISPVVLSIFYPVLVAYFIVAFDLYWLGKALRMSVFLIRGYARLRET